MITSFRVTPRFIPAVVGLVALMLGNTARGAESVARVEEANPANRVVVRFSGAMLNAALASERIDHQDNVRDVILGTSTQGKSRTTGTLSASLPNDAHRATFELKFDGVTRSQSVGYNGPAVIRTHSVTTFSASRQIVFEPDQGFYGLPPKVTARTELFVDGIDSRRGGIIGRIVRRVATRLEAASRPQATEIVRQRTEARILAGFLRGTEKRIAQANASLQYKSLIATTLRTMGKAEPKFACCTTPECLQFAASFGDASTAESIASSDLPSPMLAPLEIWVHNSLLSDAALATLALFKSQVGVEELLALVTPTNSGPETSPTAALDPRVANLGVRSTRTGNWQVLHVETRGAAPSEIGAAKSAAVTGQPLAVIARKPVLPAAKSRNRIWTSGAHTADAEFLALEGNVVRLRRTNGVRTSIALEKLSTVDQEWIKQELANRSTGTVVHDEILRR